MRRSASFTTLLVLSLSTFFASCQKEEVSAPLTPLTLRQELTFKIPPGQSGPLDLTAAFDGTSAANALLAQEGFSPDQLRDVRIADVRAVMIEPVNIPFNHVGSARVGFAKPDGQLAPFAHIDPVPADQPILELAVDHTDLTGYFTGTAQDLHAALDLTGQASGDTARVRFVLEFQVKVAE